MTWIIGAWMLPLAALAQGNAVSTPDAVTRYTVVGDAIPTPLTTTPGDVSRGRALVGSRADGLCLLCHPGPFEPRHLQGELAPPLDGVGARYSASQLRLRVVDSQHIVPGSIMPSYHRVDGWVQVGRAWRGRPLFDAQQVEDVVAYLGTLK